MRSAWFMVVFASLGCGDEPVINNAYFSCEFVIPPAPRTFDTSRAVSRFALADLDNDGDLDVVTQDVGGSLSTTLREQDDWSTTQVAFTLPGEAQGLVAADFDGDGHVDLAVVRYVDALVTILSGHGDGIFVEAASYPTAPGPHDIHLAELTGEARPDLVIDTNDLSGPSTGPWSSTMTILRNDGTGAFTTSALTTGSREGVAIGDFDHDGFDDVLNSETHQGPYELCVHRGQVDGFASPSCTTSNRNMRFNAVGDFNRDGKLDVALATDSATTGGIYLGNGDATFHTGSAFELPYVIDALAAADVNNDGAPDLLATSSVGTVETLLNAGDGTFGRALSAPTGLPSRAYQLLATDITGDGLADLMVLATTDGVSAFGIIPGSGDGRFGAATSHHFQGVPIGGDSGDIDSDGLRDIVIGGQMATAPLVLYGAAGGRFTNDVLPVRGDYVTIADFTHDKRDDVLADTTVLVNGGDRTFTPVESGWRPGYFARVSADVNGDHLLDVVDAETANVGLGNGDGTFTIVGAFASTGTYHSIATGDLDGDHHLDLVALTWNEDAVVLLGRGNGTFDGPLSFASTGKAAAVGRISADDDLDIVLLSGGMLTVFVGRGDGTFATGVQVEVPPTSSSIALADMGGDDRPDVVVGDHGSINDPRHYVYVMQTEGDGTFAPTRSLVVPGQPYALLPGDYDRDGHADMAVVSEAPEYRTFERFGVVTSFPQRCSRAAPPE